MHLNSRLLFQRHATSFFESGQRVLELGADGSPSTYQQLLDPRLDLSWETADLDADVMQHVAPRSDFAQQVATGYRMPNEYEIPVADDTFDIVLAGQVIEHVRRIWTWMQELARVTKPGGRVIIISPISWEYHEAPVDCWRIYPEGMRSLCEEADLWIEVCESEALEPPVSRRSFYGKSWHLQASASPPSPVRMAVKRMIGWPFPTSLDLITIARKQ